MKTLRQIIETRDEYELDCYLDRTPNPKIIMDFEAAFPDIDPALKRRQDIYLQLYTATTAVINHLVLSNEEVCAELTDDEENPPQALAKAASGAALSALFIAEEVLEKMEKDHYANIHRDSVSSD